MRARCERERVLNMRALTVQANRLTFDKIEAIDDTTATVIVDSLT